MRIAILVDQFPLLSETFILHQIAGLIERGHEVDIFARRRSEAVEVHPEVRIYRLLERTFFPEVPKNKLLRVAGFLSTMKENPQMPARRWLSCLNAPEFGTRALSLRLFYDVRRFLNKRPYDIIHCQLEPLGLLGMLFRNLGFLNGKLVTSWRGHDFPIYIRKFKNYGYQELYRQGDLFLPVSASLKNQLIADGCSETKINVLRSGINLSDFAFAPRKPPKTGEIRILTIGRLVENKGIEYGIRAVYRLANKNSRIRYRIIGNGPLLGELKSLVKELSLESQVSFLGWKSRSGVIEELRNSALLVAPSVMTADGSKEGIPNVLKEAMAMGIPVIGTQHSGIPELITDGKTGFLVPERDVNSLASRIDYLLSHPELWRQLGRAARARIERHYDIERLNDDLVRIYEKIL